MDRKTAVALMRHMSATDLVLERVLQILRDDPEIDNAVAMEVFRAVEILHVAVRRPAIAAFPDLDYDNQWQPPTT